MQKALRVHPKGRHPYWKARGLRAQTLQEHTMSDLYNECIRIGSTAKHTPEFLNAGDVRSLCNRMQDVLGALAVVAVVRAVNDSEGNNRLTMVFVVDDAIEAVEILVEAGLL